LKICTSKITWDKISTGTLFCQAERAIFSLENLSFGKFFSSELKTGTSDAILSCSDE
jgi:hypothetical protein